MFRYHILMAGPMLPGYGESASFAKQKIDHSPKRPLQNPFADREHLRLLISKLQPVFSRLPDLVLPDAALADATVAKLLAL